MATDFSSLDKLIEFGLGIGIATQMMNTMNNMISRTAYPGVGINPGLCIKQERSKPESYLKELYGYYVVYDDVIAGPLTEQEMSKLIKMGKIKNKTFCWKPGQYAWRLAEDIPEVNKLFLLNS